MTPFVLSPELYLTFIVIAVIIDYFIGRSSFIHSPLHFLSFLCYLFIIPLARIRDNKSLGLLSLLIFLFTTFIVISFLMIFLYQINFFLFATFYIWCLAACLGEKRLSYRSQLVLDDLYNKKYAHLRELLAKIFYTQTDTLTKKGLCRLAVETTTIDGISEVLAPLIFMLIGVFTIVILPYLNPLILVAFYKGLSYFSIDSHKLGYDKNFNYAAIETLRVLNYFVFYICTYFYIFSGGILGLNVQSAIEAFNETRENMHFSSFYPIAAVGGLFGLPIVTSTSSDETMVVGLKENRICEEDLGDLMNMVTLSEVLLILCSILCLCLIDVLKDNL